MLEVPTLELEERIRQEIEENPALEEGAETNDDEFDEDSEVGRQANRLIVLRFTMMPPVDESK